MEGWRVEIPCAAILLGGSHTFQTNENSNVKNRVWIFRGEDVGVGNGEFEWQENEWQQLYIYTDRDNTQIAGTKLRQPAMLNK